MLRNIIVFCFLCLGSVSLFAAPVAPSCMVLWATSSPMPVLNIDLIQGNSYETSVTIVGNPSSDRDGFWVASGTSLFAEPTDRLNVKLSNYPTSYSQGAQTKWAVLKIPKRLQFQEIGSNVTIETQLIPPPGFELRDGGADWILVGHTVDGVTGDCTETGVDYKYVRFWMPDVELRLSLAANSHIPGGEYDLSFDYTYGYLENKYLSSGIINAEQAISYVQRYSNIQMANIHLSVTNRCEFSPSEIHLDHGSIPANNSANGHKSDTQNLHISCKENTTIHVKAKSLNNSPLDSPQNFFSCGQQGLCRVSFTYNDVSYNEGSFTMQKGTIGVYSRFFFTEPSEGATATGPFTGNAVLSINIE
ncbi:hypothetical protein BS333_19175 [Vibrio azureus]|nr:hypothetical protein [Vibrio azureus]AUI88450.1 hypothetical protein BS333_19175 [Vibrio azureus]